MKLYQLRKHMRTCPQTDTQNILQHGLSVARYFVDLYHHIHTGTPLKYDWKLPEWVYDKVIWDKLIDVRTIIRYQIYHDCGKYLCITHDEQGGRHFPDHANQSEMLWRSLLQPEIECQLMGKDMDMHTMKCDQLTQFGQHPLSATLLITALCEVHSNSNMFGGIDSTSFKIKHKKLKKFGNKLLQQWKQDPR